MIEDESDRLVASIKQVNRPSKEKKRPCKEQKRPSKSDRLVASIKQCPYIQTDYPVREKGFRVKG